MSDIKKGYTFTDKSTDWVSNKETAIRLNKMLDDAKLNLVAGTNITITPTANGPSIAATGGGTGTVTSVNLTAGTGVSVSGGPITTSGSITVNNTAPDQVVSLTGAGTTTVTGTYPSFTISSADSTTGTVTSVAATAGTGITVSGSPITTSGTLTITNSAPDQTVVLSGGTGITTSGTYPSFTVTNSAPDQTVSISGGTGITTSGTYPSFTVTNSNPDQTVSLTGAGTTSITGTYPSFTVTSNDAFTGTVTSVAATAGTGITISGSPITSSGTLSITNSAPDQVVSLTGTGTTTVTGTYPSFTINSADQHVGTVTAVTGTLPILSSGGTTPDISINAATTLLPGSMSAADKSKLDAATNANTASAIVSRDVSGNFSAGTITANLTGNVSGTSGSTTGNAATATALQTARQINGVNFDGTANITVTAAGSTLSDTVPIGKGGTGQTTANTAFNALAPSQTGNSGKYLTTNGTDTSWAAVSGGAGGTVTSVSVTTANGVSGTVADPTTTPAITLTLGDISVATSKPSATGSVARTLASQRGDVFHVNDYGASPSASASDNLTAFNAASSALLTAGGGCIEIGQGNYSISGVWTITKTTNSQSVCIRGQGAGATKLHFSGANNGIEIIGTVNQTEGASTSCVDTVQDLSICASQAGTYKALKIVGKNSNSSSIGCLVRRVSFEGFTKPSPTTSHYWDTAIHLVDCGNAAIQEVRSVSAARTGDGILLESSTAQTILNLYGVNIQGHDFGLRVTGNNAYEGVTIHACTFVAMNTGIFWDTTSGEEQLNITDCHINPAVSYIVVNNCERVWVTNLNGLIDQRGGAAPTIAAGSFVVKRRYKIKTVGTTDFTAIGASANTVGISFVATGAGSGSGDAYQTASIDIRGSCRQSKVVHCCIDGSAEDYAIICQSPLTSFVDNAMKGHNTGIFLDSGSDLGLVTGNQLYNSAGTARAGTCVQDNGSGNQVFNNY